MPSPATTNTGTAGGTAQTTQAANPASSAGVTSFRRATREHSELTNTSVYTMTLNPQSPQGGSISLNAYGYLRGVMLTVTIAGGVAGTAFQGKGPFAVLQNIMLTEPNGAPIHQFNDGWELYAADKYGGNSIYFNDDPKGGIFSAVMPNAQFQLFLPCELNIRDGLGSLPNQNAAAMFLLKYQVAGSGSVYTTTPTTQPTVTVAAETIGYDQPQASTDGVANQISPPALNTTQFYTVQQYPIVAGPNRIKLTRVGNYIRNLGFYFTDAAGSRTVGDTNWPTQLEIDVDARPMTFMQKITWRQQMYGRYGYNASTLDSLTVPGTQDSGLFWYDFCHEFDGAVGNENRDGWLKTYGSTRLEVFGSFGVAGILNVITNDVAVAGNVFL